MGLCKLAPIGLECDSAVTSGLHGFDLTPAPIRTRDLSGNRDLSRRSRRSRSRSRSLAQSGPRRLLGGCLLLLAALQASTALAQPRPELVREVALERQAAQVALWRMEATAFEHGEGVTRNAVRASALYCLAAREGDAASQYHLGWMLAHGRGVPRDDAQAAYFFAAAAAQGDAPAARMLQHLGPVVEAQPPCMRPPPPPPEPMPQQVAAVLRTLDAVHRRTPPQAPKPIVDLVNKLAPQFQLEPHLVLAIIAAESNFDPDAVSPKNAQGLMQLIPETATRFNVRNPFDPAQSIRGGMAYLRWLMAYFEGDVTLVAAAYNAGEAAVEKYRGVPPYAETRAYVARILGFVGDLVLPFDARITKPSATLRPALAKPRGG